jgi:hypothetical protein
MTPNITALKAIAQYFTGLARVVLPKFDFMGRHILGPTLSKKLTLGRAIVL